VYVIVSRACAAGYANSATSAAVANAAITKLYDCEEMTADEEVVDVSLQFRVPELLCLTVTKAIAAGAEVLTLY
jgi:hypothetical protein